MKTVIALSIVIAASPLAFSQSQESVTSPPTTNSPEAQTKTSDDPTTVPIGGAFSKASMIGYWTIDKSYVAGEMQKEMQQKHPEAPLTQKEKEQISEQLKKMPPFVMHFDEASKSTIHTISGAKEGVTKVIAVRRPVRELDVDVESVQYGTEKGTMKFNEGRLTLMDRATRQTRVILTRISKKEAEGMIKQIDEHIKAQDQ